MYKRFGFGFDYVFEVIFVSYLVYGDDFKLHMKEESALHMIR